MNNRTFAIIKPDAIKNNYGNLIYDRILKAEFKILNSKLIKITTFDRMINLPTYTSLPTRKYLGHPVMTGCLKHLDQYL